mmetsp:Transcript_9582/g.30867  ORF Transcript_9582/g.30867 Transcript_9582/m.30867 type:complete len:388 (-) Transcript_9582:284-1447(-)
MLARPLGRAALRRLPNAALRTTQRHVSNYFGRMSTPWNPGIVVVPQQMAWVVETFGRYDKVLEPGLRFLIPLVQRVSYVFSLKEEAISVPSQTAITRDNVSVSIDGVLFVKVTDAYRAAYGVEDPHFAVTQLAQTTMRSEIGKITLDRMFEEREVLNVNIVSSINAAAADWGIQCLRYEIRDITPPRAIRAAMEMQAEAERRKRALVLDSEGEKDAEINIATGKKMSRILASEASMQERINLGKGDAAAVEAHAQATAEATRLVAGALGARDGHAATSLRLAEQYVNAFKGIAQAGSTVVVPANAADVGSMVAQAMSIYKHTLHSNPAAAAAPGPAERAEATGSTALEAAGGELAAAVAADAADAPEDAGAAPLADGGETRGDGTPR